MAENNGYLVIVEQDTNPNSPTYNTTRTREVYNTSACPLSGADYVLTEEVCETDPNKNGARTGYKLLVFTDMNINSPTYLSTYTERVQDEDTCPAESTDAAWIEISEACEIITYQPSNVIGNSGYKVITFQDMNEVSPTFNTTKDEKVQDETTCPAPDITPNWVDLTRSCTTVSINGEIAWDGTATVLQRDSNQFSSTFNSTREIVIESNECQQTIGNTKVGGIYGDEDNIDLVGNWENIIVLRQISNGQISELILNESNINILTFYNRINQNYEISSNGYRIDGGVITERGFIYINDVRYTLPSTVEFLNKNKIAVAE